MSGVRISNLPAASSAQLSDLIAAVSSGTTSKETLQQVLTLFGQYLAQLTGATFTGSVFVPTPSGLPGDGPEDNQVVPFQNVQQQASYNGTKQFVFLASTEPLTATYDNGPDNDGIGATLTNAGTFSPLVLDGVFASTTPPFERVLIKDQTDETENGIYDVIDPGDALNPWILQRSSDFDNSHDGQIGPGALGYIFSGDTQERSMFVFVSGSSISIGTDDIIFQTTSSGTTNPETAGFATLISGSATVSYPAMDNRSIVQLTHQQVIGTIGIPYVSSTTAGVGFSIASSNAADNSVIGWSVEKTTPLAPLFGNVTLSAGAASVSTTSITATSVIILTIRNAINSLGRVVVSSVTPGVGFSIDSGNLADTSTIDWAIYDSGSSEANGVVTLSGGTASVSLPSLAVNDLILITIQSASGSLGDISCDNVVLGSGFNIISNSPIDTSIVGWVHYPNASTVPHDNVLLSNGSVIVNDANILNTSVVLISSQASSASFGGFSVGTVTPATSFVINSSSPTDSSIVGYVILN